MVRDALVSLRCLKVNWYTIRLMVEKSLKQEIQELNNNNKRDPMEFLIAWVVLSFLMSPLIGWLIDTRASG